MPRIFISYRRSDSEVFAGRIYDSLASAFGDENVFKDVYDIRPGDDFRGAIRKAVVSADVLLVLIGPEWLNILKVRQNTPPDWVHAEVEIGLQSNSVTVIPVLLGDANPPSSADLPSSIQELAFRNAVRVRNDPDYRRDIERLVASLQSTDRSSPDIDSQPSVNQNVPEEAEEKEASGVRLQVILAIIALISALSVALIGIVPDLIDRLSPVPTPTETPDLTATFAVSETAAALAVLSATPTETESSTPASPPPSDTPEPPTPTPNPAALTVEISPPVVQPNGEVLVRTKPGANCLFHPTLGRDFGFDTSTGTIRFTAEYAPGVSVEVICTFNGQRSDPQTFTVAAATPVSPTTMPEPPTRQPIGDTVTLTLFRDEDSLTLHVPRTDGTLSLVGFEYRVTLLDASTISRRLDQDFAAFLGMPFDNIGALGQGLCFRLVRSGGTRPVPQVCQSSVLLLTQQVALADGFWRDGGAGVDRTVFVYRDDRLFAACGPEPQCEIEWLVHDGSTGNTAGIYPCEGTIISVSGASVVLRSLPQLSVPGTKTIAPGTAVEVKQEQAGDGYLWYQIAQQSVIAGWVRSENIQRSPTCP